MLIPLPFTSDVVPEVKLKVPVSFYCNQTKSQGSNFETLSLKDTNVNNLTLPTVGFS